MNVFTVFAEASWRLLELPCLCLEAQRLLSWSWDVLRQYVHCLGLILVLRPGVSVLVLVLKATALVLVLHLLSYYHHCLSPHTQMHELNSNISTGPTYPPAHPLSSILTTLPSEHGYFPSPVLQENLWEKWHGFHKSSMPFSSPNQHCQSTEGYQSTDTTSGLA